MKIFGLIIPLTLVACATQYASKDDGFWNSRGYSQTQLSRDTFDVYFEGRLREDERIRDFVLLRAAELCNSHQFSHFVILDQGATSLDSSSNNQVIAVGGGRGSVTPILTTGNSNNGNSDFNVRNRVQCRVSAGEQSELVYSADFIQNTIRQKYNIS